MHPVVKAEGDITQNTGSKANPSLSHQCMFLSVYLDKHLAHGGAIVGGAVDRHGLPVSGELQGELLPHQLLDYLIRRKDDSVRKTC